MEKVAVVSGASYGIGEAVSKHLLSRGFKVYGISRSEGKIKDAKFVWIKADLTSQTDINSIAQKINEKSVTLLVNNAGTAIPENVLNFDEKIYEVIFGLNFVAPIKLAQVLNKIISGGMIVNISSIADRYPEGLYSASKAALNIYFESIAAENKNIKVVNVLPSYVDTPLLRGLHKDDPESFWQGVNDPAQTTEIVGFLLDNPSAVPSGSRVITICSQQDDGDFDPEKLYLFLTDKKELKKLK